MKDGSDAIADWPLINAMTLCASMADLVVIHSGRRLCSFMTSAGVTIVADGTEAGPNAFHMPSPMTPLWVSSAMQTPVMRRRSRPQKRPASAIFRSDPCEHKTPDEDFASRSS